jgi:hypothetical protein
MTREDILARALLVFAVTIAIAGAAYDSGWYGTTSAFAIIAAVSAVVAFLAHLEPH